MKDGNNKLNFGIYTTDSHDILLKQNNDASLFFHGFSGEGLMITSTGNVGIGITDAQAKLNVSGSFKAQNTNATAFTLIHSATGDWSYADLINVNRECTKALAIKNSGTNEDVFLFYGNGVVCAKKIFTEKIEVTLTTMDHYWYDHVFLS